MDGKETVARGLVCGTKVANNKEQTAYTMIVLLSTYAVPKLEISSCTTMRHNLWLSAGNSVV